MLQKADIAAGEVPVAGKLTVTMVFPANVMKIWLQCAPLLKPSLEVMGTHSVDDVRMMIMSGKAQLWVGWNEETKKVEWLTVTQLIDYPLGLWCRVWLAGADPQIKTNWDAAEEMAIEFALMNDCAGIEHIGRDGWAKRHEDFCNTTKGFKLFRHKFGG